MAKFQLREVRVVGIPQSSSKITPKKICLLYTRTIIMLITNISLNFTIRTPWTWRSLRKHPFLLALHCWGRFARGNVCDLATEIPY